MNENLTPFNISKLIYKSVIKSITKEEEKELQKWLENETNNQFYLKILQKEEIKKTKAIYKNSNKNEVYKRIIEEIEAKKKTKVTRLKYFRILKYAAVLVVFLSVGLGVYFNTGKNENSISNTIVNDIKPGYQKATLVLSDGTVVDLESKTNELIVKDEDVSITNNNNVLVYDATSKDIDRINKTPVFNTLFVPIGGIYQVKLPDGTNVSLNSASSIKYPEKFTGTNRVVALTGEAYFEVSKNAKHPFIVKTDYGDVTVLGTHFNISAYNDDAYFATTLLEGKVKVEVTKSNQEKNVSLVYLNPDEQAFYGENKELSVIKVDAKVYSAWKEGAFYFDNETLGDILQKMSRWYNFKVSFKDDSLKTKVFKGVALKNKPLSYLLDIISETANINYEIIKKEDTYEVNIF